MEIISNYSVSPNFIKSILSDCGSDIWVKDSDFINCYRCGNLFGLFLRRHHCRRCLRIFCYYCCNNYILIPIELFDCLY